MRTHKPLPPISITTVTIPGTVSGAIPVMIPRHTDGVVVVVVVDVETVHAEII
jgi:hypothetical protein